MFSKIFPFSLGFKNQCTEEQRWWQTPAPTTTPPGSEIWETKSLRDPWSLQEGDKMAGEESLGPAINPVKLKCK